MTTAPKRVPHRDVRTRRIAFAYPTGALRRHFVEDDLVMSHVVALLSATFPEGEDFFVRSVRNYRDRITDPDFSPVPDLVTSEVPDGGDTIYLCAADEHGNLVSLIQSVAFDFGSGIVAEGTGMLLQNRGCYFSLDANHANRLEPKKRTRHTLIPAMATREGRPWLVYGSMGGDGQPQLQTQVLVNIVDHGLDPATAVARPRIRITPDGSKVTVEASYPSAGDIGRHDPAVQLLPSGHHSLGHAHAIVIDGPGKWRAGFDPRSDGSVEFVS